MEKSKERLRAHVEKYELPWPQVRLGRKAQVAVDYGASYDTCRYGPKYYVVGADGKIVSKDVSWRKLHAAITKALESSNNETTR